MPLYAGPNGNVPEVDEALSAANAPNFSNGDKTVTIPIKPGLQWGNGAPVVANDVVFWFDLLKAAVKESPANWGQYTPGLMPDNVASITTSGKYDVVMQLKQAYNPGFFLNNNLADTDNVYPLPSTDWNVDATGGPHLTDWSNPAVAKKIYDYLNKQGSSVATFARNPLWKDGDGPFKLTSFSATNSSYTLVPNPTLRRHAEADHVRGLGADLHRASPPSSTRVRAGGLDISGRDRPIAAGRGAGAEVAGDRHLRRSGLGLVRRDHQLQGQDGRLQQRDRAAVRAAGDRLPDRPAGDHQGRLQERGGSGVHRNADVSDVAVRAGLRRRRRRSRITRQRQSRS